MRVLLTYHGSLDQSKAAQQVRLLAAKLLEEGQESRLLMGGPATDARLPIPTRSVPLEASIAGRWPQYAADGDAGTIVFDQLADTELAAYRQAFRAALDAEVDHWNPDIIHVQHAAIHAQLALETGVPYVCSAWGEELELAQRDPRILRLVEQGAENAGRILIHSSDVQQKVARLCEGIEERISPGSLEQLKLGDLTAIYQSVLADRFGRS